MGKHKNKLKALEGSQESVFSTPDTGKKKKKKGKGETPAKVAEVSVLSSKVKPRRLLAEECVDMTNPSKKKKKKNKDHGRPLNSQEETDQVNSPIKKNKSHESPLNLQEEGNDRVNSLKRKNKNHDSPSTSQEEEANQVNSSKKKKKKKGKARENREHFLGQLNLSPRRDSDYTDSPSDNKKKQLEEVQNEVFSPSHKRPSDTDTPTHKSKKHKTQDEPSTPQARVRHNSLGTPQQNKATSDKSRGRETSPPPSQETPKSKKKKGLDSHSDSQGTPQKEKKKKKRNKSSDAPPMNIDEDVKIEEMVPPWTRESVLSLVHQVREHLPRKDNKSYRVTLNKFDWSKIVVGDYSTEMIKEQFNHIMTKMTVIKPLTLLVNEIEVVARKKFEVIQTRSAPPLTRFLMEYLTPERKADLQKRKVNMLKAVGAAWNKLSNHEKQVYIDQFKEGHTHNKHTLPEKEERPYVIWAKHVGHTGKAQTAFSNLPAEEKITYIELALQRIARVEQDKREHGEPDDSDDEDEQHSNAKKRVLPLVSRDDLELFLNSKKIPALPPKLPLRLYYDNMKDAGDLDHIDPMKRWLHASSLYRQLPQEAKGKYKAKHDKILARYKVWADQQDEVTLLAKRMYTGEKTKKSSEDNPKKSLSKTKAKNVRDLFPNTCRNYMSCPKFKNEPTRPPRTPLLHYIKRTSNKLPDDTSKTEKHKISTARWKELDDDDKELFNTEWKESLKNYESELLAFVGEIDKKTRMLYLGFHRVALFPFFKRDIFTDYPNSKYPVNEETFPKLRASTNSASNEPENMLDLIKSNSRSRQKFKPSQTKECVSTDEGDGDASDSDEQTQHRKTKFKVQFGSSERQLFSPPKKVKAHPLESKSEEDSEEEKGSATSSGSPRTKSPAKSQRHEMDESSEEEHISPGQIQSRNSPTKCQEADESDKSSEDEEVIPAKHLTKRSPVKQQTTNDDPSENEIPATQSQIKKSPVLPKKTQIKKSPVLSKKISVQTSSEEEPASSDDDDDDNSDFYAAPAWRTNSQINRSQKKTSSEEEPDSSDDDDDDISDFDAAPAWRTNSQINRSQKKDTSSSEASDSD